MSDIKDIQRVRKKFSKDVQIETKSMDIQYDFLILSLYHNPFYHLHTTKLPH